MNKDWTILSRSAKLILSDCYRYLQDVAYILHSLHNYFFIHVNDPILNGTSLANTRSFLLPLCELSLLATSCTHLLEWLVLLPLDLNLPLPTVNDQVVAL